MELRLGLALQWNDALREDLAQLDAPLIEGVDVPDRPLGKNGVLVKRNELPEDLRPQSLGENHVRPAIALEDAAGPRTSEANPLSCSSVLRCETVGRVFWVSSVTLSHRRFAWVAQGKDGSGEPSLWIALPWPRPTRRSSWFPCGSDKSHVPRPGQRRTFVFRSRFCPPPSRRCAPCKNTSPWDLCSGSERRASCPW